MTELKVPCLTPSACLGSTSLEGGSSADYDTPKVRVSKEFKLGHLFLHRHHSEW